MAYLDENGLAYFKGKLDQIADKLNDQITETDTALDNLTSLIERDTASGSIVEVNAEYAAPVEKLVVNIEPQQDLHGYDNPWPAGGGKNLLSIDSVDHPAGEVTPNIVVFDGSLNGTYTLSVDIGSATAQQTAAAVLSVVVDGTESFNISWDKPTYTYTGNITRIVVFSSNSYVKFSGTIKLQLEQGTTATAWTPVSNICPISGWTGAKVKTRAGKNLFDVNATDTNNGYVANHYLDPNGKLISDADCNISEYIPINPNSQYTIYPISGMNISVAFYTSKHVFISAVSSNTSWGTFSSRTFVTPQNAVYARVSIIKSQQNNLQLELGPTATAYEPYTGNQISVTFPSEAGTVYGGTLTINPDRTGTLVVDRAMVDLGTLNWTHASSGERSLFTSLTLANKYKPSGSNRIPAKAMFECYTNVAMNFTFKNGDAGLDGNLSSRLVVCDNRYADAVAFKSAMSGVQLCYELATPITYTLTETEVSGILSTIRGTNYIWANTGDIAELKYQSGGFATTNTAAQMIEKSAGTKADVITETASGSIVSFSDGADGLPVKSLTVNIEPQQDLHGYDNPWPAGGGKNIFNVGSSASDYGPTSSNINSITNNGIAFNVQASGQTFVYRYYNYTQTGQFTVSGTTTKSYSRVFIRIRKTDDSGWMSDSDYTLSNFIYNSYFSGWYVNNDTTSFIDTFSIPQCLYWQIGFGYGNNEVTVGSVESISNIQLERGSTATSYTPYSNICPISGWTGANLQRTGKNLNNTEPRGGYINLNKIQGYSSSPANFYLLCFPCKPNTTYTVSATKSLSRLTTGYINEEPGTGVDVFSADASLPQVKTTTTGPNAKYLVAYYWNTNADTGDVPSVQVELGSTATAYEPYTGSQISIAFPTEAGTVYGGTLTINPDRTGTLVVDRATETLVWGNGYSATVIGDVTRKGFGLKQLIDTSRSSAAISDIASFDSTLWAEGIVHFDVGGNGRQAFVWLPNGTVESQTITISYPIATPVTFQLTESEISGILSTLYGTNNIWANTGDVEVEYPVDTKLYIQQLTKPTEDDMTADNAIAAGTFFMIGNTLYLATAQIAAGATITPGTNATKLSLADALNQLNA